MEAFERQDGEPVKYLAGCFRVKLCIRSRQADGRQHVQQVRIDAFHAVIAALVGAVNGMLHVGDLLCCCMWIACAVFQVPKIEVCTMQGKHCVRRVGMVRLVPCVGCLVDAGDDTCRIERRADVPARWATGGRYRSSLAATSSCSMLPMSVPGASGEIAVDAAVRRVLVYRLGSLGDTLVALPSLHLVERAFPNAERRMLTNIPVASLAPAAAAVLGDSGLIHSYENYPVGLRSPWRLLAVLLRLRRFRPQVVIYLKATTDAAVARRDAMFLRLTGARRLIGLPAHDADLVPGPDADGVFEPEAYRLARRHR